VAFYALAERDPKAFENTQGDGFGNLAFLQGSGGTRNSDAGEEPLRKLSEVPIRGSSDTHELVLEVVREVFAEGNQETFLWPPAS